MSATTTTPYSIVTKSTYSTEKNTEFQYLLPASKWMCRLTEYK